MPQGHPGPPPEMPPHGSSDPDADDYNPVKAEWEDRVGSEEARRIKKAWQEWAGREGDYIKQQLGGGLNLDEIEGDTAGENYRDAPEHGASQFAYWRTPEGQQELAFLRNQGLQYSIKGGHATWDPSVGAYLGERRNGVEIMRDRQGNIIRNPDGSFKTYTPPAGAGGVNATSNIPPIGSNALNPNNTLNAANYDWGRPINIDDTGGRGVTTATRKTYGDVYNNRQTSAPLGSYGGDSGDSGGSYGSDLTSSNKQKRTPAPLGAMDLAAGDSNLQAQSRNPWHWL